MAQEEEPAPFTLLGMCRGAALRLWTTHTMTPSKESLGVSLCRGPEEEEEEEEEGQPCRRAAAMQPRSLDLARACGDEMVGLGGVCWSSWGNDMILTYSRMPSHPIQKLQGLQ